MKISVQIFLLTHAFFFLMLISSIGMVWFYDRYMFNILRNHPTVFPSGCIILYRHQQCMRLLRIVTSTDAVVASLAILIDVWRHLIVVLISVTLVSDNEHFFLSAYFSFVYLLCWWVCSNLLTILKNWIVSVLSILGVIYIFWIQVFYCTYGLQTFSPSL